MSLEHFLCESHNLMEHTAVKGFYLSAMEVSVLNRNRQKLSHHAHTVDDHRQ